ncbi:uncharacterized protein N7506_002721 [Penicillium brevicompactum]|uniref:uncharacterized protein n=1 Tax=Penicillium brevicompactum TaxID=5074 RepID=UPI002540EA98|nr:uncharacterized protein N7506_002721 [Penicillium brevicompactum]KAJ5344356.1 hypothetical protein N7506_002721 [Penicillium brevicompactum]
MTEPISQGLKRKRKNEKEGEHRISVVARHRGSLATRSEAALLPLDEPTPTAPDLSPFQVLWRNLVTVESPPTQLDLYMAVISLEDQYQRWGWNEIAAKVVRNKFSSSEVSALRATLHQLSPRVCYVMLGIDMSRDGIAIEHALSYNIGRFKFERDVSELDDGPVKTAYHHFSLYFGQLATPEVALDTSYLRSFSPQNPQVVKNSEEEQLVRTPEIPACHSLENTPHSLQPGIALCKYIDAIDAHECYYRKHQAAGVFHERVTALLQQLDRDRPG